MHGGFHGHLFFIEQENFIINIFYEEWQHSSGPLISKIYFAICNIRQLDYNGLDMYDDMSINYIYTDFTREIRVLQFKAKSSCHGTIPLKFMAGFSQHIIIYALQRVIKCNYGDLNSRQISLKSIFILYFPAFLSLSLDVLVRCDLRDN